MLVVSKNLNSVNAYLFFCSSVRLESDFSVNKSEQSIIFADTYVVAGVDFSSALANDDSSGCDGFAAESFDA